MNEIGIAIILLGFLLAAVIVLWNRRKTQKTMDAIEKWAADEFRSTNGQLQWIIAEALKKSGRMRGMKEVNNEIMKE